MTERTSTTYATMDGLMVAVLTAPVGLVPPPVINLHKPEVGAVEFYHAQAFGITIQGTA